MRLISLRAFYYEAFPIEELTYFDIPESRTGGVKSGGMDKEEFEGLVASIKEKGMINPVYVEDDNLCLRVQLGNNRVIAMKQLGYTTVKAVIITKGGKGAPAPGAQDIPLHKFNAFMERVHPGDTKYLACSYARNIRGVNRQVPE
jgi:hypothetical protein